MQYVYYTAMTIYQSKMSSRQTMWLCSTRASPWSWRDTCQSFLLTGHVSVLPPDRTRVSPSSWQDTCQSFLLTGHVSVLPPDRTRVSPSSWQDTWQSFLTGHVSVLPPDRTRVSPSWQDKCQSFLLTGHVSVLPPDRTHDSPSWQDMLSTVSTLLNPHFQLTLEIVHEVSIFTYLYKAYLFSDPLKLVL